MSSVFYGVRVPAELSERIEATGRGKSAVITDALRAYFADGAVEPGVQELKPAAKIKAVALKASGVVESRVPAVESKAIIINETCSWCEGKLIPWGSGKRCENCKRNQ